VHLNAQGVVGDRDGSPELRRAEREQRDAGNAPRLRLPSRDIRSRTRKT
jgi:hypothetical protein